MKTITVNQSEVNGKVIFMANNVQLSWPRVWREETRGQTTFGKGMVAMFDKANPGTAAAVAAIHAQINALITKENNGQALPAEKICLHDGDLPGAKTRYAGHWFLTMNNANSNIVVFKPGTGQAMVEADYDVLPDTQKITDGCIASVKFTLWFMSNSYGKRVNGEGLAVRWSEVGTPLASDSSVPVDELAAGFDEEEDWETLREVTRQALDDTLL